MLPLFLTTAAAAAVILEVEEEEEERKQRRRRHRAPERAENLRVEVEAANGSGLNLTCISEWRVQRAWPRDYLWSSIACCIK